MTTEIAPHWYYLGEADLLQLIFLCLGSWYKLIILKIFLRDKVLAIELDLD